MISSLNNYSNLSFSLDFFASFRRTTLTQQHRTYTRWARERCEHIEPFSIGYTRGELKLQNNTSADNETIHHRHLSYDELVIYFLNMISASSTTQTSSKQRTTAQHKSLLVNKPPTTPTTTRKR